MQYKANYSELNLLLLIVNLSFYDQNFSKIKTKGNLYGD